MIMKQILLLSFFTLIAFSMNAQTCVLDQTYVDSAVGVYPPPFSVDRPDGGIPNSACINDPYEFVLTFKVPPTISVLVLDSIVVQPTGAVTGLPDGLSYSCNPPNCIFKPNENDGLGCVLVFGTPNNPADVGDHQLMVATQVFTNLTTLDIVFPDNTGTVPNADGEYVLTVNAENSPECTMTSTDELLLSNIQLRNTPNPFAFTTTIEVDSRISGEFELNVFDLTGRNLHNRTIRLEEGDNQIPFDGSNLTNGMYLYSITQGDAKVVSKMIIQR